MKTLTLTQPTRLEMMQPDSEDRVQAVEQAEEASITPWQHYTAAQRQQAEDIGRRMAALGVTITVFTQYSDLSTSVVSRIVAGKFPTRSSLARKLELMESRMQRLEEEAVKRRKPRAFKFRFHVWEDYQALEMAVDNATIAAQDDQEGRHGEKLTIVDYVAQFGWGKDEMIGQLMRKFGGVRVYASDSWSKSSFAAYMGVAEQLGVLPPQRRQALGRGAYELVAGEWRSFLQVERAILKHLMDTPQVLYFTELELGSTSLCNLWKEISNRTRCVVVRFCLPEFYVRMNAAMGVYGDQVNSRTEGVISGGEIPASLVQALCKDHAPQVHLDNVPAQELAAFATELCGLRCVIGVLKAMQAAPDCHGKATIETVAAQVRAWRQAHSLIVRDHTPAVSFYLPVPAFPKLRNAA